MNAQSVTFVKTAAKCGKCLKEIETGEEYNHRSKILCEDCCMDMRMTRDRKTHWLYLRSIKAEYLRPAGC